MSEKHESRIKLVIPGVGYIEIAGTNGFVSKFFETVKIEFFSRLAEKLKDFKGNLEMVEKRNGKNIEVEIVEK